MKALHNLICISIGSVILMLGNSCGKVSDDIPAFIKVDSTFVKDKKFGNITSEIYALQVFADGEDRGIWEIPFRLPVVNEGARSVIFRPFIKRNNLSLEYIENPNLKAYVSNWNFLKGVEIDSNIGFVFDEETDLVFSEKFEGTNNFSNSTTSTNSPYGKCIQMVANNTTGDSSKLASYIRSLAFSDTASYMLEFDYYMPKGVFTPTLSYFNASNTRVNLFSKNYLLPNTKWTHVYWELDPLRFQSSLDNFYITFILLTANGEKDAQVFIDNVNVFQK